MARLKTFLIYLLLFIALYLFVSIIAYGYLVNTYKSIEKYEIDTSFPAIQIVEAKATYINGYIVGKITNNMGKKINATYLKVDFYSANQTKMGTKYVKVENFNANEIKEFKVNFQYENIASYKMSFVDRMPTTQEKEFKFELTDRTKLLFMAGALFVIYKLPSGFLPFIF